MNRFRSKLQGMQTRKSIYTCLTCLSDYREKTKQCACGSRDLHYFPSTAEMQRFKTLRLEEHYGQIDGLNLQPAFPIRINGVLITTYKADFEYARNGQRVVEDVKGLETDVFKLKKKLVEAEYGIRLTIVKG